MNYPTVLVLQPLYITGSTFVIFVAIIIYRAQQCLAGVVAKVRKCNRATNEAEAPHLADPIKNISQTGVALAQPLLEGGN